MATTPPQRTIPPMKEAASKCCPLDCSCFGVVVVVGLMVVAVGEVAVDVGTVVVSTTGASVVFEMPVHKKKTKKHNNIGKQTHKWL